jgi:hypothetical protein
MRTHGVSPQCSALQVLGARETEIAAVCGESDGMRSDFSQRDSEVIERLRSAARAREAITCVRFRRLFFGYFLWTSKESSESKGK